MSLQVEQLHKSYGAIRAVDGVSLSLAEGESLALLGPSGCGKSTLLRLIAGLEQPDSGRVSFAGVDITSLPPQSRHFGVVFQDFALFPHLDVAGNVAFGLVEQRVDSRERAVRVENLLKLVGLEGYQRRRVHQLSGGQQQRVALARAVAPSPRLLLLDEPLSNLDEALRDELKDEIVALLADLGTAAVYVTHDQAEAFTVAERVAVMRQGRIVQVGDREQLLERPRDTWTARFLGHENVWEGDAAARLATAAAAQAAVARSAAAALPQPFPPGAALLLRGDLLGLASVRPDNDVADVPTASGSRPTQSALTGTVERVEREALGWRLTLRVPAWDSAKVIWRGSTRELHAAGIASGPQTAQAVVGAKLGLVVSHAAWHVFPSDAQSNGARENGAR